MIDMTEGEAEYLKYRFKQYLGSVSRAIQNKRLEEQKMGTMKIYKLYSTDYVKYEPSEKIIAYVDEEHKDAMIKQLMDTGNFSMLVITNEDANRAKVNAEFFDYWNLYLVVEEIEMNKILEEV